MLNVPTCNEQPLRLFHRCGEKTPVRARPNILKSWRPGCTILRGKELMGVMKTSRRASTLDANVIVGKPLPTSLTLTGSALKKNARFLLSFSQPRERRQIIWDVRACWLAYSCLRLSGASCLNLQTSQSRVVSSMPRTSSLQIDHFSNHRSSTSTKLPGHTFRHGTNQRCQLVINFSPQIHAENPPKSHYT